MRNFGAGDFVWWVFYHGRNGDWARCGFQAEAQWFRQHRSVFGKD